MPLSAASPKTTAAFSSLLSVGEPDWLLLGVPGAMDFPAVKWRQVNLDKITKKKRQALVAELESALGSSAGNNR